MRYTLCFFLLTNFLFAKDFSVGRDPTWPSLYSDAKIVDLTLFSGKIVEGISESEDIAIHVQDMNETDSLRALENGTLEGILTTLPETRQTRAKYSFSTPIFMAGPVLVVRQDSKIERLSDLNHATLSIYAYDDTVLLVQKNPRVFITTYESVPQALLDVSNGVVAAALIPTVQAHALIPHPFNTLKIASKPLDTTSLKLITLKGKNRDLLFAFNRGLKRIKKTGLYKVLRLEYSIN